MNTQTNLWHPWINPNEQLSQVDVSDSLRQTEYYQQQIFSLLDWEWQTEVSNFSNSFESLMNQLEDEVAHLSSKTTYDYEEEMEYIRRIILSEKFIQKAFSVLLNNNKTLNSIYKQIISLLSTLPNSAAIKSHIFETYFFDWIIESLQPIKTDAFWKQVYGSNCDKAFRFDKYKNFSQFLLTEEAISALLSWQWEDFEDCIQLLLNSEVIDFSRIKLDLIDFKFINQLFSLKSKTRSWLLSDTNLCNLNNKQLSIIFKKVSGIKHISLKKIKIDSLSTEALRIIFGNLNQVKMIKLNYNDIWLLNNESLKIIFSNLRSVRHISLNSAKLGLLSKEALDIIFTNLKWVKFISLWSNDFSQEQVDYINKHYFKISLFDNYA